MTRDASSDRQERPPRATERVDSLDEAIGRALRMLDEQSQAWTESLTGRRAKPAVRPDGARPAPA